MAGLSHKAARDVAIATEAWKDCKRQVCEIARGPHDLLPQLTGAWPSGKTTAVLVPDPEALETLARLLVAQDRPSVLIFQADAFTREKLPDEAIPERGQLAVDLDAGDFRVREALTVVAVEVRSGAACCVTVPYSIGDDGLPIFDEASANAAAGGAVEALRAAVRG